MSKEHINVEIDGRSYPITVSTSEVEGVQAAASAVNDRLTKLKSKFAVKDRIDLFAMTALQLSIKNKQLETGASSDQAPSSKDSTKASTKASKEDESLTASIEDLLLRLDSTMEG